MFSRRVVAVLVFLCAQHVVLMAGGFSSNQNFKTATPEELAMKSPDGAPALILDWVRTDDDTDGLHAEYYRIKIFSEEGKKYANVEEPYFASYPLFQKITDISGRTVKPDGSIVPFDGKVYDKVLYRLGREAVNAKAFSLPDVQVGSVIEYRYIRRSEERMLLSTTWSVQHDIPVQHARLTLKPYSGHEFTSYFTYMGLPNGAKPVRTNDHYDLELANVPAFQRESFAPPDEQLKPRVNFFYTTSRVLPQDFWRAESETTSKKVESFIGKEKDVRDAASKAAANAASDEEKARKLYAYVQSFRNLTFDADSSERPPAKNAAAVVNSAAGSSDDINRAFVALARAAGLDADVVRVAPRDRYFFSDKLPDADQMSDEVAVVTIGGKAIYLDPGTPFAPFGIVAWQKTAVPGYRVKRTGPEWIKTSEPLSSAAVLQRRADLRLDADVLKGTVTETFLGQEAMKTRLAIRGSDESAKKKALQDELAASLPAGSTATLKTMSGMTGSDQTATAVFDVEIPNAVSHAGTRVLVPASLFTTRSKNPFASAARTYPIYFEYPRREEDEVKVTFDHGVNVAAVPPAASLDAGAVGYTSVATRNGDSVIFKRSMFIDTIFVDREYYEPLRRFFTSAAAADAKPIVLQSAN